MSIPGQEVISDLVRQALTQSAATTANSAREPAAVYGFRPFPSLDAGRIAWNAVLGSRQVIDVYLLALAAQQYGRLVTLDRAVPLKGFLAQKQGIWS